MKKYTIQHIFCFFLESEMLVALQTIQERENIYKERDRERQKGREKCKECER